ncbi:MAG: substrate-binding domain-containing protein [Clostridiales bacterium]|jgi:phosphate transport system substrate-binding protein|nr:substrate-binding domain-containing protein [Clostridiales bacterium]
MKKLLAAVAVIAVLSNTAFADTVHLKLNENRALVNGEARFLDRADPAITPVIADGRTMVPVRFVAEAFGCDVAWDGLTERVVISNPQSLITLRIGGDTMTVEREGVLTEYELDAPARLIGDRTYLPIRAIAENALGKMVSWYEEEEFVCIADAGETYFEDVQAQLAPAPFTLQEYPKIDCSTATVPFVNALNREMLGIGAEEAERLTVSNKTHGAYVRLIEGDCDVIFVTEPGAEEDALAEQAGVTLEVTPFCGEGLVFLTHKDNPVQSLTLEQIRDIYQGNITTWREVGGANTEIIAYQRNPNAGSQTLMENVVMRGLPLANPPSEEVIFGMGELIDAVAVYQNTASAIGYSVYYYANGMHNNPDIKLLEIDGVAPSPETIQNRTYPLTVNSSAVTVKERKTAEIKRLITWILSAAGQRTASEAGYVPGQSRPLSDRLAPAR